MFANPVLEQMVCVNKFSHETHRARGSVLLSFVPMNLTGFSGFHKPATHTEWAVVGRLAKTKMETTNAALIIPNLSID